MIKEILEGFEEKERNEFDDNIHQFIFQRLSKIKQSLSFITV